MRSLFVSNVLALTSLHLVVSDDDMFWQHDALARVPLALDSSPCDLWLANDLSSRWERLPENVEDDSDADVGLGFGEPVRLSAGLVFVRNNERTRMLYELWVRLERHLWDYQAEDRNLWKEQPALQASLLAMNHVLGAWADGRVEWRAPTDGLCASADGRTPPSDSTCLRLCLLSRAEFPSGQYVYGDSKNRTNKGGYLRDNDGSTANVVVAHANFGKKSKKPDMFKQFGFWCLDDKDQR